MARTKFDKKEPFTPSFLLLTRVPSKVKRVANCVAKGVNHYPDQEIDELRKEIAQVIAESELIMSTMIILCFNHVKRAAEISKKIKAAKDVDSIHLLETQRIIIERIQADNPLITLLARLDLKKKPLEAPYLKSIVALYEADPTLSLKEALKQALKQIRLQKDVTQHEERKLRICEQIIDSIDLLLAENKAA